jgi:hypothetical protein
LPSQQDLLQGLDINALLSLGPKQLYHGDPSQDFSSSHLILSCALISTNFPDFIAQHFHALVESIMGTSPSPFSFPVSDCVGQGGELLLVWLPAVSLSPTFPGVVVLPTHASWEDSLMTQDPSYLTKAVYPPTHVP